MKITVPVEQTENETRIPLLPDMAGKLGSVGIEVEVESGLGEKLFHTDESYQDAGAKVFTQRDQSLSDADVVIGLNPLPIDELARLKPGCILISFLDPFDRQDILDVLCDRKVSALGMEMIPRNTLAQKMDALSSQANLAGYAAVMMAAEKSNRILPMMMTPAGTIKPARVFIIGAGVAGLQAIATAKRLGARVDAFDTRPVVAEQIRSLGAKVLEVDLGETGQTKDGYAKALTDEQLGRQRDAMARACAQADIVITTAQLFGRKAPRIITRDMIEDMSPGSIIVDLAVSSGGNVEGSVEDEEVIHNDVTILGSSNFPGRFAANASQMYSSNLTNFILHLWDQETKQFALNQEDDIIKGSLVTHGGEIVNDFLKSRLAEERA